MDIFTNMATDDDFCRARSPQYEAQETAFKCSGCDKFFSEPEMQSKKVCPHCGFELFITVTL